MSAGPDGSRLCLACGLCCQGILHDWAKLTPDEVEAAEGHGLKTFIHPDGPAFRLPCPCHRDGRCAIYAERPTTCRGYQCKLLRRYLAGEVTAEDGLRRIEQVKRLVDGIRRRIGAPEDGMSVDGRSVWHQLAAFEEASPAAMDADLKLDAAALVVQCHRHFASRAEPMRVWR